MAIPTALHLFFSGYIIAVDSILVQLVCTNLLKCWTVLTCPLHEVTLAARHTCHCAQIHLWGGGLRCSSRMCYVTSQHSPCLRIERAQAKPSEGRRWLQTFEPCSKGANQETGFPTFASSNFCCWCRRRDYCWWWRSILAPPPSPPQLLWLRAEMKVRNCHNLQQACGKRDCEKMKFSFASHTLWRLACETRWNHVYSYSYVLCISNLLKQAFYIASRLMT